MIIAGALAGFTAWSGWRLWESHLGHENLALKIGAVFGPATAAGLVYWLVSIGAKVPAAHEIVGFVFAKFLKGPRTQS